MASITFSSFSDVLKDRFKRTLDRCIDAVPQSLNQRYINDALIYPVNSLVNNVQPAFQCGAYDLYGDIQDDTILVRGNKLLMGLPAKLESLPEDLEVIEEALYGGFLTRHYGHILTESLARLWPYSTGILSAPIVFCGCPRPVDLLDKLLPLYCDAEQPSVLLPQQPVLIKRLCIPEPTMINRGYAHPLHISTSSTLLKSYHPGEPSKSILYLSRSKLSKDTRRIINEREIEVAMSSIGGIIFHPQEHSFEDQLLTLSRSNIIVTPLGSAAHTLLFSKNQHKVIYLCADWINPNYPMIDSILTNSSHYLGCLERLSNGSTPFDSTCDVNLLMNYIHDL